MWNKDVMFVHDSHFWCSAYI